jgi:type IV pilus assembly protein PilM
MEEANLRPPATVANAIRIALERIAPNLSSVTIVLPDAALRVFLLEFDSLPKDREAVVAVLRLRLRKIVPFVVEQARISYQMLPQQGTKSRVLAAIIPGPILAEYEMAVKAAGYKAGAVLPTGLASLATLPSSDPALIASLGEHSVTTSITNSGDLLLYRTNALPMDTAERILELKRDIAVAAAYFEDQLMTHPQQIYFSGTGTSEQLAASLSNPGLPVVDMADKPQRNGASLSIHISIAGVAGALAGAR